MLGSAVVALTGLAIRVAAVVWTGLIAGLPGLAFDSPLGPGHGPGPLPSGPSSRSQKPPLIERKHDHDNRSGPTVAPAYLARPRAAIRASARQGCPDYPPSRLTAVHVEPELIGDCALTF
jgi:hypothetical protein